MTDELNFDNFDVGDASGKDEIKPVSTPIISHEVKAPQIQPVQPENPPDGDNLKPIHDTTNGTKDTEIIRLSIGEAARLFGVNSQTIRRAIQSNELTYIVVAGRYKINFESLVKWSQAKTTVKNKLATRGIGQYVEQWRIRNTLYSPKKPE